MSKQLQLFSEGEILPPKRPRPKEGKRASVVFHDYESYIAKFTEKERTTDDTFTPQDVYECVVDYVRSIYDMTGKVILRPFYPGGDYETCEYPDNGVVIDNPPFSIFMQIVRFYTLYKIPFFIFGNGMTIMSCCKYCSAVIANAAITFENKANIKCNFATNLLGDVMVTTAPTLAEAISKCPSQNQTESLPIYEYPAELLSVSALQTIVSGGIEFSVKRSEAEIVKDIDNHPNGLFGDHLLISRAKAKAKEKAKAKAKEKAKAKAKEKAKAKAKENRERAIKIPLSKREKRIVANLKDADNEKDNQDKD